MSGGLDRYTIEIQDEIINDLRKENERLRELLRNLVENAKGGDYNEIIVDADDFDAIEKEVSDESK